MGGQIIFASFTLLLFSMPLFSYEQVGYYTIEGESLWRNQGYGVSNHKFHIENYLLYNHTSYILSPDPVTGSCDYNYYTSDIMPLYNFDEDAQENTLKIRPYSINNYSDYINGVNVLDCYAIAAQVSNSSYFAGLSPTDDAPYRFISADADYDCGCRFK